VKDFSEVVTIRNVIEATYQEGWFIVGSI